VKLASLNALFEEDIYVEQPKGFVIPDSENKLCKLQNLFID